MQKITSHLWFDKEAKGAAEFYTSVFASYPGNDSKITSSSVLHDIPSGSVDLVRIELWGQEFAMISAGPLFKFNPSVSFLVSCETRGVVSAAPAAEQCGWLRDQYGLSWQVTPVAMGRMLADRYPEKLKTVTKAFLKMKKFNIEKHEKDYRGTK